MNPDPQLNKKSSKINEGKAYIWNPDKMLAELLACKQKKEDRWIETGLPPLVENIIENYEMYGGMDHLEGKDLPSKKAVIEVKDYQYATSQLSQTTLRSVLGEVELDALLSERDVLNQRLQTIIDEHTDPWGIKVSMVEIKHVDLPQEMQRAMAKQAEAERERRAKVIHADGEFQASEKLLQAAVKMAENPTTIQLRYLQTLMEIGAENNSTIIFPFPIELLRAFIAKEK